MGKMTWNRFVVKHPQAICVVCGFAWRAPRVSLAADGRQIPTPYAAVVEAVARVLKGDWAIRSERQQKASLIHIIISDQADLQLVQTMFQLSRHDPRPMPRPCREVHEFPYDPGDYGRLLKALGYASLSHPRGQ